jgi:hypothetical protein
VKAALLLLAMAALSLLTALWYTWATAGPAALPWLALAPLCALGPAAGIKSLDWFPYRLRGGLSSAHR